MTFIIEEGLHCYKVKPFGLKNIETTYQRIVDRIFKDKKGKSVGVYVDDFAC